MSSTLKKHLRITLFCLLPALVACVSNQHKDIPDVSHVQVDVKIKRFEQDLFSLDTNNVEIGMERQVNMLKQKYPDFMEVFTKRLIADPGFPDKADSEMLREFITQSELQHLYDTCMIVYDDIGSIEEELKQAFRYLKYYFPEKPIPEVISYISEYAVGTFTYGDSLLGIGWDFYMGKDFPYYHYEVFPRYILHSMDRKHLVSKAIEAVIFNILKEMEGNRLLDHMIHNGKMLYLKELLLPELQDSVLMEYSGQEMEWVIDNELLMWAHLLEKELLYSTKYIDFQKLVSPSPGSPGMPREAPGRTGNWVGWQIVKAYMQQNPEITARDLVVMKDAQEILSKSSYKPRR